ncbi:MAG: 30S ribosomal protein S17 [Candidatus Lambdaproteobacteria bacterium]|nr:30S ribosomal protein S17 [Candidatus Lambdaproteobacteria bacterium]
MPEASPELPKRRAERKVRQGVVVSDKMDKSIVVQVERTVRHPLYAKIMKRTKKYVVHDEENGAHEGDVVRIMESRPLSRRKRWRLIEVVSRKAEL